MIFKNIYQNLTPPQNLTFDEASLFWRLRGGEGVPRRAWHRPLEKNKTWEEIKKRLDHKLNVDPTGAIFHQIYPKKNRMFHYFEKFLRCVKCSFFLQD